MKNLITLLFFGLLVMVLSCEEDRGILDVQNETITAVQQDALYNPNLEISGEKAAVQDYKLPRPVNNFRATDCTDPLYPSEFHAAMFPGESRTETKTICIPPIPPEADILYSFDMTGSMWEELDQVKENCESIADYIKGCIPGAWAGIVTHKDYPGTFTSCGYTNTYGGGSNSPYDLVLPLTFDLGAVHSTIDALPGAGGGADGPESYSRVFFETYKDNGIGWRNGSVKFVVAWLDDIVHDCNLNGIGSTGVDLGRNGVVDAGIYDDDLPIISVLDELASEDIYLVVIFSGDTENDPFYYGPRWALWQDWDAAYDNVTSIKINADGTIPDGTEIGEFIVNAIEGAFPPVPAVKLMVENPMYEDWVSFDLAVIENDPIGGTFSSELTFTVPYGTPPGDYSFRILMKDIDELYEYDYQDVFITVKAVPVDIKPTSCRNPLNLKSGGVVSVAINGTADFDITTIDPESVMLEGVPALRWSMEDVSTPYEPYWGKEDAFDCTEEGPDGFMDLVFKFNKKELITVLGDPEIGDVLTLILKGMTFGGYELFGQDVVVINNKGKA